jgi:hypothetical protein
MGAGAVMGHRRDDVEVFDMTVVVVGGGYGGVQVSPRKWPPLLPDTSSQVPPLHRCLCLQQVATMLDPHVNVILIDYRAVRGLCFVPVLRSIVRLSEPCVDGAALYEG